MSRFSAICRERRAVFRPWQAGVTGTTEPSRHPHRYDEASSAFMQPAWHPDGTLRRPHCRLGWRRITRQRTDRLISDGGPPLRPSADGGCWNRIASRRPANGSGTFGRQRIYDVDRLHGEARDTRPAGPDRCHRLLRCSWGGHVLLGPATVAILDGLMATETLANSGAHHVPDGPGGWNRGFRAARERAIAP